MIKPALLLVTVFAVTSVAHADEMEQLKARFQERETKLQKLKTEGAAGETFQGFIETPKTATDEVKKLLEEENTDRRRLYALIAQKEGGTPDLVADRAARRNFSRAKSGEMLKFPDGVWRKKG